MSEKQVRGQYTQEFKREAAPQVKAGESVAATIKVLGGCQRAFMHHAFPAAVC